MRIVLLLVILLDTLPLQAQQFEAGIRGGIGMTLNNHNSEQYSARKSSFDRELYVRYETNGWAFENSLLNYTMSSIGKGMVFGFDGPSYDYGFLLQTAFYNWSFTAEYDLTRLLAQKEGRLHNYIGVTAISGHSRTHYSERQVYDIDQKVKQYSEKSTSWLPDVGLINDIRFSVSRHFTLSAVVQYDLSLYSHYHSSAYYKDPYGRSKLSGRIGIGYKF